MLAIIKTRFGMFNIFILPLLFNALVRPLLEFGNVIWARIIHEINRPGKGSNEGHEGDSSIEGVLFHSSINTSPRYVL